MTTTLFLVIQFIIAIVLTIAVLLQKSSSIGLGAYSGSNESLFGAKGPAGFLAKFTFFMAFLFVINTLLLGYFYNKPTNESIAEKLAEKEKKEQKATPNIPKLPATKKTETPKIPSVPVASETNKTK